MNAIRPPILLALVILTTLAAGCASPRSEASTRGVLQALADTSSTRFNIVADRLARKSDDLDLQATLNREKLSVANVGIENAMDADAMSGLLDMAFQFDLKARSARQRVDRLRAARAAGTQPAGGASSLDPFAEQLAAVHVQNSEEIWRAVAERLRPAELNGLRAMIDDWYAKNADLNRSSVKIAELRQFAGNDPSRSLVISLVDLEDTNQQVDRLVWGAQRLYENSHWEVRRILYDAFDQFRQPRDDAIAAVTKAVTAQRKRTIADAGMLVRQAGLWLLAVAAVIGAAAVTVALLIRRRHGLPSSAIGKAPR